MTLAARDALLSRLSGVKWPAGPLLDTLGLSAGADVLDVGAGEGALLRELRRRGHTGRLAGRDPQPGEGLERGTAERLPHPDCAFDAVLLVRVLAHLVDTRAALREARRVLRPGGMLVLAAHGKGHLNATWRALGRPAGGPGPDAALRATLAQAGLVALRLDSRFPVFLTMADAEALVAAYGLSLHVPEARFPVVDTLHLTLYVHKK